MMVSGAGRNVSGRSTSLRAMRFKWAVLSRAAGDPGLERAVLAEATRGPVLVEDGLAMAMAMVLGVPVAPAAMDLEDPVR